MCGKVSTDAALKLGVAVGTPVAASLIDAHAGALGLLAASAKVEGGVEPNGKLGWCGYFIWCSEYIHSYVYNFSLQIRLLSYLKVQNSSYNIFLKSYFLGLFDCGYPILYGN